jgi:signal transduction histidine kinase
MPWALHLLAPTSRWRRPLRTAQVRLTALYGGLFLVSGIVLLAITYVLFERATNPGSLPGNPTPQQLQKMGIAAAQNASDLHQLVVNSAIALAIVAALAIVIGWIIAGRVLRPVRTISATARRISASNLRERLALDGADDEFKQLGDTLNDLFARLEASFEAQQHFVANASHELRTPLTAERTLLQVALANSATTAERWRSTGQELLASSREQERLIEGLLTLASSEGGLDHREPVDLSGVTDAALSARRLDNDRLGLHVETTILPAPLDGDPLLIERLVTNLIDNAVQHNIAGGRIEITTGTEHGCAVLRVANTGPVIPPGEVDRLFQPFQRLDARRVHYANGHGLGLSIVRAIAAAHGATIAADAPSDGGLTITVTFAPQARAGLGDTNDSRIRGTRRTQEDTRGHDGGRE